MGEGIGERRSTPEQPRELSKPERSLIVMWLRNQRATEREIVVNGADIDHWEKAKRILSHRLEQQIVILTELNKQLNSSLLTDFRDELVQLPNHIRSSSIRDWGRLQSAYSAFTNQLFLVLKAKSVTAENWQEMLAESRQTYSG